jgi:general secretion pathway protein H
MRARGFSLVEMLVVLALLGFAAALASPRAVGVGAAGDLAGAAAQLRDGLRAARALALTEGRDVAVAIDPGGRALWVDGRRQALAGNGRVAASGATPIVFHAIGGSSGGRVLLRAAERRREILVEPVTGRIREAG